MVVLTPASVTLGSVELRFVDSVVANRTADRLVVEHTDLGPHVGLVDVPERRVTITVRRRVQEDEASPAKPGDSLALAFVTGESASAGRGRRVSANVVVTSVTHDVGATRAIVQTITMIAFSTDGATDPLIESAVAV